MSESALKMIGLAIMATSVFLILFGLHATEAGFPDAVGIALGAIGTASLLVGLVIFALVNNA